MWFSSQMPHSEKAMMEYGWIKILSNMQCDNTKPFFLVKLLSFYKLPSLALLRDWRLMARRNSSSYQSICHGEEQIQMSRIFIFRGNNSLSFQWHRQKEGSHSLYTSICRYDFAFVDAEKKMYQEYFELLLQLVRCTSKITVLFTKPGNLKL